MSRDLANDGSTQARGGASEAGGLPPWPVLARLPRVGAAPPAQGASRSSHTTTSEPAANTPPATGDNVSDAFHSARQRRAADHAHDAQRRYDGPDVAGVAADAMAGIGSGAAGRLTRDATRRFRIDPSTGRRPPGPTRRGPRETTTISGSVFRLHAALAPHMGVLGLAALVFAGSLLYWLTVARHEGPGAQSGDGAATSRGGWSHDANKPGATSEISATPEATPSDQPLAEWSAAPHVAAAPADVEETPPAQEPAPPAPAGPALEAPAPVLPPLDDAAEESALTPTPETELFPTTPYAAFAFLAAESAALPAPGSIGAGPESPRPATR